MATTEFVEWTQYNGTDYDTLLPAASINNTVTLTTAGWSNLTQTVTLTGVTTTNAVWVSPAPASFTLYNNAGIYCSSQGTNSLTFTCAVVPSSAITVNVAIFA